MVRTIWLPLVALVTLIAVACGGGDQPGSETDEGSAAATQAIAEQSSPDTSPDTQGSAGTATSTVAPASVAPPNVTTTNVTDAGADSGSSSTVLTRAVERTQAVRSARFALSMTIEGLPDAPGTLGFDIEGASDPVNQRFQMSTDISSLFEAATTGGLLETDELGLLSLLLGDGVIEIIFVDGTTYLRWSLFTALFGAETEWVSIAGTGYADALDSVSDFGLGEFPSPDELLDFLADVGSVEEVGTETLRGVETTHYAAVIDLEAVLDTLPAAEFASLESELLERGLTSLPNIPVELWIDDDGLIRKVALEIDFSDFDLAGGDELPGAMSLVIEFFAFDDEVVIEAPPAVEVTPIDEAFFADSLAGFALGR